MKFNKPDHWGHRFQFPENRQIEYDNLCMRLTDKVAVTIAEKYDDIVVSEIANAARTMGASDVIVLNKMRIMDALMKCTPRKYARIKYTETINTMCCPTCNSDAISIHPSNFCPDCGQAIDYTEEVKWP